VEHGQSPGIGGSPRRVGVDNRRALVLTEVNQAVLRALHEPPASSGIVRPGTAGEQRRPLTVNTSEIEEYRNVTILHRADYGSEG
jgi:hypothetical protein